MLRHYRVILIELLINTLSSYTNISNAAVGNTFVLPTAAFEIFCVTWQGIDYKLPEDDTIVSKHVGL
jgi:hypothetical protein